MPDAVAIDALEIGARVLDREQTGANAEFVKTEFEKVSKSVEAEFGERAKAAAEELGQKLDEVFDPDSGHLSKSLDELFSDGSSDGGAAPRQGAGGRGAPALARGPAQAVRLHRRGREPAGRLQGAHGRRDPARPTSASTRPSARCSRR